MSFGAPLGLLALLALPLIVAIHLFRRRFRPRPVAGLFLWGDARVAPAAGRRRDRLVHRPSLYLELAAALSLVAFLSDPHCGERERARHLVVVLDDRARLEARRADGRTAAEALRAALDERLAGLAGDDRVTLVASGRTARLLAGPAASPAEARAVLGGWRPAGAMAPLDDALALAADLARDGAAAPSAELWVASDREPPGLPEAVGVLARGEARATSGLADARWLREGGERLVVRVVAHGGPTERALVVRTGGRELARRVVRVAPGDAASEVVPLPAGAAPPESVEVALEGPDPLPVDDRATLFRPPAREVRVALAVDAPALARALAAVDGVRLVTDLAQADLVALDAETPAPAAGEAWVLRLSPGSGPVVLGPFLTARGDAVLRGVDLTGVLWVGAPTPEEVDPRGDALLLAGEAPLLSARTLGRARELRLAVDLSRSSLADHPAWPALVSNLVEARRAALPGLSRVNVPLGQEVRATLPDGAAGVRVAAAGAAAGDEAVELVADGAGEVVVPPLGAAGTYALRLVRGVWGGAGAAGAQGDTAAPWAILNAVAVDPELGDLREAASLERAATPVGEGAVERRRGPAGHLVPLGLAALAALLAWGAWRREDGASEGGGAPGPGDAPGGGPAGWAEDDVAVQHEAALGAGDGALGRVAAQHGAAAAPGRGGAPWR